MVDKWDFWSNQPPKKARDPQWVISSIKNWLVRSVRTYPNISSYSAVEMKWLKTIQDDLMAENEIFGQVGHQSGPYKPLVTPCGAYQVSKTR